jgi:two-component system OmpR family sensor kinase/two-component system sensor histidine kinase BaeS
MRLRLFLAFTAIILITLISVGFLIQKSTINEITSFAERGGFSGADKLADTLENYYSNYGSWDDLDLYIEQSGSEFPKPQQGGMTPWGTSGQGQGSPNNPNSTNNPETQNNTSKDFFAIADSDGNILFGQDFLNSENIDTNLLELTIPLVVNGETVAYLIPQGSFFPNQEYYIEELGERINQATLISFGFVGIIALIFALIFGYFLTKPINLLDQAASKMAEGDYTQRVQISGSHELKSLGDTFNNLAESIQHHRESRTAMTSDIAHELRTPLAVQRANLEAIQDGIYPLDQENLSMILEQNNMLAKLVDDLRTLAQTDEDELTLDFEDTDISAIIKGSVEAAQAQTEKKKIKFSFEKDEEIPLIPIDIYRFQQVLNNLIQNAIRHTPEDGEIKILLEKTSDSVVMKIIDSGPGVPEKSLPHIFNRFYRADSSRSREYGGTGLGLTISKRFVEAHGGTLTAANHPDAGAEFKISFPI